MAALRSIAILVFSLTSLLLLITVPAGCRSKAAPSDQETVQPAPISKVVALGRLVPEGEIIKVSVSNAQDSRVNRLLVEEGGRVTENQVIALLQGVERREADLRNAQTEVRLREAELKRVLQGDAKVSEVTAQRSQIQQIQAQIQAEQAQRQASIASARAVVQEATLTRQRREALYIQGAISQADLDVAIRDLDMARATLLERQAALQQTVNTLQASIRQAEAELKALTEVRPVDAEIAQAQLEKAKIEVEQRQADLEDVRVRAPATGQILRINTRVGEQVNTAQGIVELARTQQMYAIAEIYESDIVRVQPGQTAKIQTDYGGFEGILTGQVETIGLQIGQRSLQDPAEEGPSTDQGARIVEVKVKLSPKDSQKVSRFTNMLVKVAIETNS